MKLLIIANPAAQLFPQSDSTLDVLREALRRDHTIYWATDLDIGLDHEKTIVTPQKVLECKEESLPSFEEKAKTPFCITEFDQVWIRKNPPFDSGYMTLCWLLQSYEDKVTFLSKPSLLLRMHEKFIPFLMVNEGFLKPEQLIPTRMTFSSTEFLSQSSKSNIPTPEIDVITKPWLGFGGDGVKRWNSYDQALAFTHQKDERTLIQPFIPEVQSYGDRRVFFLKGKYQGDFIRLPKKNSILSNLAQGGTAKLSKLSEKEQLICDQLEKYLDKHKVFFVGADILAERLSEVNITSPTGFVALKELGGTNLAKKYLDLAETLE